MPEIPAKRDRVRRAHLCACSDPTAHADLRAALGRSYLAIRFGTFRSVVALLRKSLVICKALECDNVALANENARLRASLRKTNSISLRSPVFHGGLGGRTAVEVYRGNLGEFIGMVNEVGVLASVHGEQDAEFALMGPVKADLECLWAAAPATEEEALRRDDLRHKLSVPHERALLVRPDELGEHCRQQFISDVASSGVDTSTQELVRRSGEMRAGTAIHAPADE